MREDLFDDFAFVIKDGATNSRLHDGATVGNRGIHLNHLHRRCSGITLADRKVDGVTGTNLGTINAILFRYRNEQRCLLRRNRFGLVVAEEIFVRFVPRLLPLTIRKATATLRGEVYSSLLSKTKSLCGLEEKII